MFLETINKDLVFIDTETTGEIFGYHELIDIAAIRCSSDGKVIKRKWCMRIKPYHPERLTKTAKRVNGFSIEEWSKYKYNNSDIWVEFINNFSGCVPVCHNPAFDRSFITIAASLVGVTSIEVDHHWIGTESIAWPMYKKGKFGEKFSLAKLCDALNIEPEPIPHSALGGAELCRRLYNELMRLMDVPRVGPR